MATKIVTKNSSTASSVPTAAQLVQGELAVNVADKRLYTEDNAGAIVELGTNPSTLTVTGEITANGGIALGDNDKATFGDGDDLQIFHDGSNSFINDTGTGSLLLRAADSFYVQDTGGKTYLKTVINAQTELSYNNGLKLATTSTGIDVTGTASATSVTSAQHLTAGSAYSLLFGDGGERISGNNSSSLLNFFTGATERMRIDSSGNVGIGTSSPDSPLEIQAATNSSSDTTYLKLSNAGENVGHIDFENGNGNLARITGTKLGSGASGNDGILTFSTAFDASLAERMRIDSSGNLLVGKSSTNYANVGAELKSDGKVYSTVSGGASLVLNRKTNDGDIISFYKDNAAVGSIGTVASNININSLSTGRLSSVGVQRLLWDADQLYPATDNVYNLGFPSFRFDDIYATNATIQTSDRNEKQDIAELNTAETAVAVACKGLLRKFRWKDSVAEKGDEARTHFGIIAQDLQAAFEAEGLDAGDYAMFMSDTWTDEETNEEKTRMGVRYSELLAFIIAAL